MFYWSGVEDTGLLAPGHRLDLVSTLFFCHICNCVSLSRCFSAPENGGALHKMAVIVSERSEAAGELQPTLFSGRLQFQTSARRPNEKAICAKRANPIIAQVSIKKHISLFLHPEQCSHCLMGFFLPLIPINVQQITISALKDDLCLHSFYPITFRPAHVPHRRRGLLIMVRYAAATCVFIYPSNVRHLSHDRNSAHLFQYPRFYGGPRWFPPASYEEKGKNSCLLHHQGCL